MELSLYLHREIIDILSCYGNLPDVINRAIDDCLANGIDVCNKPPAPERTDARRITVDIHNNEYLELLAAYPSNSSIPSLRRFVYWFVEEEIYDQLNWVIVNNYKTSTNKKLARAIDTCISDMQHLLFIIKNDTHREIITDTIKLFEDFKR